MSDETEPAGFDFLKVGMFGRRKKNNSEKKKYASFSRRMWAATVDSFFLIFTTPLVDHVVPLKMAPIPTDPSDPMAAFWLQNTLSDSVFITSWVENLTAQMLVFCLFSAICWHFWSATPGKMLFRIKIVDANTEQHITDQQILLRLFGYIVSSVVFFLGFFWIAFDKRRQGWHDKIADTVVITLPWFPWSKKPDVPPA